MSEEFKKFKEMILVNENRKCYMRLMTKRQLQSSTLIASSLLLPDCRSFLSHLGVPIAFEGEATDT